jgi:DNA-binding MarR family transcriptional regulator
MVGELSRKGVVDRREDDADRRRTIVSIAAASHAAVDAWLAMGARAWRTVLEPLTADQRKLFVDTLLAYEHEVSGDRD